jgi:hypothetical protein
VGQVLSQSNNLSPKTADNRGFLHGTYVAHDIASY